MSDLPVLPDVSFVETDPQEIINSIISGYEELAGYTLADGDPRRLFLLSIAYIIISQRQQIDASGKSNLLYYAQDDYLDHIGALRRVTRIDAQPAISTERFTLSAVRGADVGIPAGTRVTADNSIYWRTTEAATITAGNLFVDVPIEALTAGDAGNGIGVGSIARLVDPIPYVQSVSNTTETSGGREKESNDAYRSRIYQAPAGFSIAGPRDAYIFWALTANSGIVDVSAESPSAGEVEIVLLLADGAIPSQSVLDQVEAVLSEDTIRPLTDLVTVSAPTPSSYDINITYYIRTADAASEADIQARVADAVAEYIAWQRSKLGRDINPDELVFRLINAGVKRVAITAPTFNAVAPNEVAQINAQTVNYGGLEDD